METCLQVLQVLVNLNILICLYMTFLKLMTSLAAVLEVES